ncbi:MAG: hypothetical protein V3V08_25460 [Nannocystaceae bacterium]
MSPSSPEAKPGGRRLSVYHLLFLAFSVGFVALQLIYVATLPLNMDEFLGGYHAYEVVRKTPYAEFQPYKTLLGYYPQALLLSIAPDTWSGLMWTKVYLVLVNGAMMVVGAFTVAREFRKSAVLCALVLFGCMSTFLERSLELRVDMMTAWMGFLSLLLLVRGRPGWAGVLVALSFLTSQKGIYFVVAGFAGLAALRFSSLRRASDTRAALHYGAAALAVLLLYLGLWSAVAGPRAVFSATFLSHQDVVLDHVNGPMHAKWWGQSIWRNAFYYAFLVLGLWRLERLRSLGKLERAHLLTLAYGVVTMALCLAHSKPWPYFLVFLFPTAFVVHTAYLDAESRGQPARRGWMAGMSWPMLAAFVGLGVYTPLMRVPQVLKRDLSPQRDTLQVAEHLLSGDETYFAGINFMYRAEQVDRYLGILGTRTVKEIGRDRQAQARYVETMRGANMKFVIRSYRIKRLPKLMKKFIDENYAHLWANVDIYAPTMVRGGAFELKFGGHYTVMSGKGLKVDGQALKRGQKVHLAAGAHESQAEGKFRLKLIPNDFEAGLGPATKRRRKLFPKIYNF